MLWGFFSIFRIQIGKEKGHMVANYDLTPLCSASVFPFISDDMSKPLFNNSPNEFVLLLLR